MTTRPMRGPVARVRAAELGRDDGPTDGQLLARFVEERDEVALAALVRRLGPAVLGVCRRVIGDAHLAEDAFQAVFLVLVRRAETVRPREQVGAWLYGVAYRVARRARAARFRRLAKERPMPATPTPAGRPGESRAEDLLPVLDEELAKLPEHYRAAILACDVEGRTRQEAAARLGIPGGTLSNRLAAARKMLARRLTRRGVGLGAGALAAVLSQTPVAARVPPALVGATARLAIAEAGLPAPAVSALADGEVKMLLLTKLGGALAGVLALAAVAVLFGGTSPAAGDDRPARKPAPVRVAFVEPRPAPQPAAPPAPKVIDTDGPLDALAFSPDGKLIAAQTRTVDGDGKTTGYAVKIWEAKTGKEAKTVFEGKHAAGVAFSPDGKHVAAGVVKFDPTKNKPGDVRGAFSCEVVVWDVATGKETARLMDSTAHAIYHVAYSPDGKYLAAGGGLLAPNSVPDGGEVAVWDAATGKVLWGNQEHKGAVRRLAFSADGKLLATPGADGTVRVWDSFTGKHQRTLDAKVEGGAYSAAFSPDGKLVAAACGGGTARVWDLATGEERYALKGGYTNGLQVVRFLPDGTLVTAGTAEKTDGNLKFWDAKTGKLLRAIADPSLGLRSMDVSADGKAVAVGSWEKTLVVVPLGK